MKYVRTFFEVLLYLFTFLAIQFVVSFIVTIASWLDVDNLARLFHQIMEGKLLPDTTGTLISSVVSSILTLAVFLWLKWSPFSRTYLQSRPWGVLVWVVVLALGTIVPSTWLGEQIPYEMPLLRGHGKTPEALKGVKAADWYQDALDAALAGGLDLDFVLAVYGMPQGVEDHILEEELRIEIVVILVTDLDDHARDLGEQDADRILLPTGVHQFVDVDPGADLSARSGSHTL